MYVKYFKRPLDVILSLFALIVLSPLLLVLIMDGAIAMKGNPFFVQLRPGKKGKDGKEKIFKLIKFRTMSNAKDKDGNPLPDEMRLNKYGRFLRSTSLDELPELINIVVGDMSVCGPRPLLVEYLPFYTEEERHRHDVRPGLTGWAQINGRSYISWEEIFAYDLSYIESISFIGDLKILFKTAFKVLKRDDIADFTTIAKKDGKLHVIHSNKDYIVHQALDVERKNWSISV